MPPIDRRTFLGTAGAVPLAVPVVRTLAADPPIEVSTNTYPWGTFATRDGRAFQQRSDETLDAIAAAGLTGYEPALTDVAELDGLGPRLQARGLRMPSLYASSTLHDETLAPASVENVLRIARRAATMGTRIIVTNLTPIRWGAPENKTDAQIRSQAVALDRLGREVRALGLTLAYHNHDSELRLGAREFHHMLTATDPAHVKFCLDVHWVFRGCGTRRWRSSTCSSTTATASSSCTCASRTAARGLRPSLWPATSTTSAWPTGWVVTAFAHSSRSSRPSRRSRRGRPTRSQRIAKVCAPSARCSGPARDALQRQTEIRHP